MPHGSYHLGNSKGFRNHELETRDEDYIFATINHNITTNQFHQFCPQNTRRSCHGSLPPSSWSKFLWTLAWSIAIFPIGLPDPTPASHGQHRRWKGLIKIRPCLFSPSKATLLTQIETQVLMVACRPLISSPYKLQSPPLSPSTACSLGLLCFQPQWPH